MPDAGVVDQHVAATVRVQDLLGRPPTVRLAGHVAGKERPPNSLGDPPPTLGILIGDINERPRLGAGPRDGLADARSGPGDQGDFPTERKHGVSFSRLWYDRGMPKNSQNNRFEVARLLERAILTSQFRPGDRLPEMRIAKELGVSQASVREALQDLEGLGLVLKSPNRGSRSSRNSAGMTWSLYQVRRELEPLACGLAADADAGRGTRRPARARGACAPGRGGGLRGVLGGRCAVPPADLGRPAQPLPGEFAADACSPSSPSTCSAAWLARRRLRADPPAAPAIVSALATRDGPLAAKVMRRAVECGCARTWPTTSTCPRGWLPCGAAVPGIPARRRPSTFDYR